MGSGMLKQWHPVCGWILSNAPTLLLSSSLAPGQTRLRGSSTTSLSIAIATNTIRYSVARLVHLELRPYASLQSSALFRCRRSSVRSVIFRYKKRMRPGERPTLTSPPHFPSSTLNNATPGRERSSMILSHLRLAWSFSFLSSASYAASFLRSHSINFEAHSSSYTTSIQPYRHHAIDSNHPHFIDLRSLRHSSLADPPPRANLPLAPAWPPLTTNRRRTRTTGTEWR